MKIFIDENIPTMTLQQLLKMDHDVRDIRGTSSEGAADDSLWLWAQNEKRLLITTDAGFMSRRNEHHYGILIVRLKKPNRHKIHERVMQAMKRFLPEEWPNLLVVVQDRIQRVWRVKIK